MFNADWLGSAWRAVTCGADVTFAGYAAPVATRTPSRPRPGTRQSGARPSAAPARPARPSSGGGKRRAPEQRKPPARRSGPGLPARLLRAVGRLLAGLWMLL